MMPWSPAIAFCSMVGQARRHTAAPMGPSTIERSNFRTGFLATSAMGRYPVWHGCLCWYGALDTTVVGMGGMGADSGIAAYGGAGQYTTGAGRGFRGFGAHGRAHRQ